MERSGIRRQKEGVVQGRDWGEVTLGDRMMEQFKEEIGRSDIRGQEGVVQGRDWREVALEDRMRE